MVIRQSVLIMFPEKKKENSFIFFKLKFPQYEYKHTEKHFCMFIVYFVYIYYIIVGGICQLFVCIAVSINIQGILYKRCIC